MTEIPLPPPNNYVVQQDMQPFTVASLRGVLTALFSGTTTFLATWTTTDNPKTIAIATLTVVVSVLTTRVLGEGTLDSARVAVGGKLRFRK